MPCVRGQKSRAYARCTCARILAFFPGGRGIQPSTFTRAQRWFVIRLSYGCHTVVIRESARESIAGPTISPSPDFQPVARPIGATVGRDARAMSKDADSDRSRRGRAASSRARETSSRPEPHERFRRELVQRFVTCYPTIVECSK